MIATYAAVLAVCGASLAIGQAAIALCGAGSWSWLAPAVGLALLCAICWGTVRLGGDGVVSAVVVRCSLVASVAYLWGRLEGGAEALRAGWPVALVALLAASLPFAVEGHFGILGTSFNPDMSQHLLAADRLAHGQGGQLLHQGYPLGPHAIVVALNKGLGIGLVQGFSGLTVAVAILAPLTALAAFSTRPLPRTAGALVVGLAYVVASYFAQGAFKETIQALLVLAFVLALRESTRTWRDLPLRFVPAALLAVGSVYVYSFPGLIWLIGTAVIWALLELAVSRIGPSEGLTWAGGPRTEPVCPARRTPGPRQPCRPPAPSCWRFSPSRSSSLPRSAACWTSTASRPSTPTAPASATSSARSRPSRRWASGPRATSGSRLATAPCPPSATTSAPPSDSSSCSTASPAVGAAASRRSSPASAPSRSPTPPRRVAGTPYTAAKAIEIASPIVALTILLPLLDRGADASRVAARRVAGALCLRRRGVCSLLALANAPVGPTSYSPALTGLRPLIAADSTLVLASDELLADQHGAPFVSWELRGGRVCIKAESEAGHRPPHGVRFVVTRGRPGEPPFAGLRVERVASPYVLWESTRPVHGQSPCPLIAERQARQGPAR